MTEIRPEPDVDARPSRKFGLAGRCPRCAEGALFSGPFTLSVRSTCERCGLDYKFVDAGDGPAIFAIFILGFLVLGCALVAEFKFGVPGWGHVLLWGIVTPVAALVLLRALKGKLVALQFKHNAGDARIPDSREDKKW